MKNAAKALRQKAERSIHRFSERCKRILAIALSVSMVCGSMPAIPVYAATDDDEETEAQEFVLNLDDMMEALQTAMDNDEYLSENEYRFTGAASEDYEELFEETDLIYDITPEFEDDDNGSLKLKVFAHLSDEQNLEFPEITDDTRIIFLLLNNEDDAQSANILVDNYETGLIDVPAKSAVELENLDSEVVAEFSVDDAELSEGAAGGTTEDTEDIEVEDTEDDEEDSDSEKAESEETVSDGIVAEDAAEENEDKAGKADSDDISSEDAGNEKSGSDKDDSEVSSEDSSDKGSDKEGDSSAESGDNSAEAGDSSADSDKDAANSNDSGKEDADSGSDKADSTDKNADNSSTHNSGSSDKSDDSSSGNDGSNDNNSSSHSDDNSGSNSNSDKSASISVKRTAYLTSSISEDEPTEETKPDTEATEDDNEISLASTSDAKQADDDDDLASPSDAEIMLMEGETYDPVIVNGNKAGVAFVTTIENLGNYGIMLLDTGDIFYATQDGGKFTDSDGIIYETTYTLSRAISAAGDTGIVQLLEDIDLNLTSTSAYVTVSSSVHIDLNYHTLKILNKSNSSSNRPVFRVSTGGSFYIENGTIEGKLEDGYFARPFIDTSSTKSSPCSVEFKEVTLQNFSLKTEYAISLQYCSADFSECTFINNTPYPITIANADYINIIGCIFDGNENSSRGFNIANSNDVNKEVLIKNSKIYNNKISDNNGAGFLITECGDIIIDNNEIYNNEITGTGSGGGFYIQGKTGSNITVKNNTIYNNISTSNGGGFVLTSVSGNLAVSNNTLSGNTCVNHGGGASITTLSTGVNSINITGNTFKSNSASGSTSTGGGLYFYDTFTNHDKDSNFNGNIFNGNNAYQGGGLYLYGADSDIEFIIDSGEISENSATEGGGIYQDSTGSTPLHLYNSVITDNTAGTAGSAIYGNNITMYETMGVLIYNTEDISTPMVRNTSSVQPAIRAMNGALIDWYDSSGNEVASGEKFSRANNINAEIRDNNYNLPEDTKTLIISDNSAITNGGGIYTDEGITFGTKDSTELKVNKKWEDSEGNVVDDGDENIPHTILIDLMRIDGEKSDEDSDASETALETVWVTDDDNWEYTFTGLPTKYEATDDTEVSFSYDIVEEPNIAYEQATDGKVNDSGIITITNILGGSSFPDMKNYMFDADADTDETGSWSQNISAMTGEEIKSAMTSMLPRISDLASSDNDYKMVFHGELDDGFVFDQISCVYLDGTELDKDYYSVEFGCEDGCSYEVTVELTKLYAAGIVAETAWTDTTITVLSMIELDEENVISGSYSSNAWYKILNGEDPAYTSNTSEAKVVTYGIKLSPMDNLNGTVTGVNADIYYDSTCEKPVMSGDKEVTAVIDDEECINFYGIKEGYYYVKLNTDNIPYGYELNNSNPVYVSLRSNGGYISDYVYSRTIRFTRETIEIDVEKVWDDDNDPYNYRPDSVTLNLYAGTEKESSIEINSENEWKYTFKDLPKYTDNGREITYSIEEEPVDFYISSVTGNADDGFTITNTLGFYQMDTRIVAPDNRDKEYWISDTSVMTGEAIEFVIDVTTPDISDIDDDESCTLIFHVTLEGHEEGYWNDVGSITSYFYDSDNDHIIHVDSDNYTVNETCGDGCSFEITIDIKNLVDEEVIGKIDFGTTMFAIFFQTSLNEDKVTSGIYNCTGYYEVTRNDNERYFVSQEDTATVTTNEIQIFITDILGEEIDVSGFTAEIYYDEDCTVPVERIVDPYSDSSETGDPVTSVVIEDGTLILSGLAENTYYVKLIAPDDYEITDEIIKSIDINENDGKHIYNLTYETLPFLTIEGRKIWDDNDDQDNYRPESIIIRLWADGTFESYVEVSADTADENGNWIYSFQNLPKYKDGAEVTYTITEDAVDHYTTEYASDSYDIINTHIPDHISVTVTKIWVDNNDQDGCRPESVTVELLADGKDTGKNITLATSNDWIGTFDVELYHDHGEKIEYTVMELELPEGYDVSLTGNADTGFVIVNTHIPETIDIKTNKVWDDASNQDGLRPAYITIRLSADGEEIDSLHITADDYWMSAFRNKDKYANGKPIAYTITEDPVENYASVTTGNTDDGYTVTNTHTPETINVSGSNTWVDNNNQDGMRPDSITIHLKADGDEIDSITVTEADGWSWEFENLAKYKDQGVEIVYTITVDTISDYSTELDGYDVINTHTPGKVAWNVQKFWEDDDDRDGERPEEVTIKLLKNGEDTDLTLILNEENNWFGSFTDLDEYTDGKLNEYSVAEFEVEDYNTSDISRDGTSTFNIRNVHTLITTDYEGTKVWDDNDDQDGIRPDSVTIYLIADGEPVVDENGEPVFTTATADTNWTWSFKDLLKYHDHGISVDYTVREAIVEGYDTEVEVNGTVITNTHTPETITIAGSKTWDDANDQDGKRPISITVNLFADGSPAVDENGEVITASVTANDNWGWSFTGLPKYRDHGTEIVYTITEDEVEEYEPDIDGYDITNSYTPETISIEAVKIWDDNDDQDGIRPSYVTFRLFADGDEKNYFHVTEEEDWTWEITGLDKYRDSGTPIVYMITEDWIDDYEAKITDFIDNGDNTISINVTNTHTPETIDVEGTKIWNDADDQDGVRPAEITINLLADDEVIGSATVTAEDSWSWSFKELPVYANGKEISYTVTEDAIEDYESEVNGYDVTNTHTPETIDIEGSKTWDDADDQDGIRPNGITINLLADNEVIESITVTSEEDWSWSFKGLPVYANGKEISYTITEDAIEDYESEVNDYNVTNTHIPETLDIEGSKTWNDANDQDGIRPAEITINLLADDEVIESITVTSEEDWSWSFKELPVYANGEEISYTITENSIEDYESEVNGYDVTNTHIPETIDIEGSKSWDDAFDQDGIRPAEIVINLLADGEQIDSITVAARDSWSWTFTELPKYADGVEIDYTITEEEVEGYDTVIAGDAVDGFDVINTHEPATTEITVTKEWDDADDQDGKRPTIIDVQLLADGDVYGDTMPLSVDNDWTYTWTNLPVNSAGSPITYTVNELTDDLPEGYESVVGELTNNGDDTYSITITNSYTPEKIDITANKTWVDKDDQDGSRPESITIRLLADGTEVDSLSVTAEDGWKAEFKDVAKYVNGREIEYSVTEDPVEGYVTDQDGFDFTNTHISTTIDIPFTKAWDDDDDKDGIRPESITVTLMADGEPAADDDGNTITATVTADDGWSWTFTEIPKYHDHGVEVVYDFTEDAVFGYTDETTGDTDDGFTMTNTQTVTFAPPDTETTSDPEDPDSWAGTTTADTGSEIEFEIGTTIPSLTGMEDGVSEYSYVMRFHEVLDDHLQMSTQAEDIEVYLTLGDVNRYSLARSRDIATYSVSEPINITPYCRFSSKEDCSDGCTFELDVDIAALYEDGVIDDEDLGNVHISVLFYAELDDEVQYGSYTSTTWYEILNGDELLYTSEETSAVVTTFEMLLSVVGSDTSSALEGVTIGLYYDEACTEPVMRGGEAVTGVSGDDGSIAFPGLAGGTYYLKALEVPEGYEISSEALKALLGGANGEYIYDITFTVTKEESEPKSGPEPDEGISDLTLAVYDKDGNYASGVVIELFNESGESLGTYTQDSTGIIQAGYLPDGDYTVRIISDNGYTFTNNEYSLSISSDMLYAITATNVKGSSTGSTGHRSSGGGGGSSGGVIGGATIYTGTIGLTGNWVFDGMRFLKSDGTYPSNEYLMIDGVIYAFYTNGYAVSFDHTEYYTPEAIAAAGYIPTATGTWDLCGWWFRYNDDGSYPHNGWARLSYNDRTDWYYFDVDGWMVTGWLDWNGSTYYLHPEFDGTRGHMYTGWNMIDGYWYYFDESGALLRNAQTPDGQMVDASGRMIAAS